MPFIPKACAAALGRVARVVATASILFGVCPALAAAAAPPSVSPYGEVARFGGFAEEGGYGSSATTNLKEQVGETAHFVDPVGMAVDATDPKTEDKYAIYVLDLVNPQALQSLTGSPGPLSSLSLEYRIQKVGSDGKIIAAKRFTLAPSASTPGLHAVSLTLDDATDAVYVLLADVPPTAGNASAGATAAYALDSLSAGRETGDTALASLNVVAGPETLQPGKASTLEGDFRGESIVADDAGGPSIAIAGNRYTSEEGEFSPAVERIVTSGPEVGSIESTTWPAAPGALAATEDTAAKDWAQKSSLIEAASANPDGSLNVTLGPTKPFPQTADDEPNMATISGDLQQTAAVLPWASAAQEPNNLDAAATIRFHQEISAQEYGALLASGASEGAGTLAPSVVQLAGEGGSFPSGLYAGVVAQRPQGGDEQSGKPFSWALGSYEGEPLVTSLTSASLAIRIFDTQGESLGMIGNTTSGGPCNLQGGPYGENEYYGSFAALAPGRGGALFALVQADLDGNGSTHQVDPAEPLAKAIEHPLAHVQGDEVVELAPGAGQNGAAGEECPQPTGGFSITNETEPEPRTPSTGSGPVTVPVGTTLKLESEANLRGGTPWAYEWQSGEGVGHTNAWSAGESWRWPSGATEFAYTKAGSYIAQLNVVNDFGSLPAQRTVNVVEGGKPTPCFEAHGGTAGEELRFDASCTKAPEFDAITNYHWSFGDGHGEAKPSPLAEHRYLAAGSETVTLTVTDALKQEVTTTKTISIAASSSGGGGTNSGGGGGGGGGTGGTGGGTGGSGGGGVPPIDTSPTEVSPKVASTASIRGTVAVKVSCPASKPSCSGAITLKTLTAGRASAHGKHAKAVVIARASFGLRGGQSETVQLHLTSVGVALLRAKHLLKVVATITASDPSGHVKTVTETITLRAAVKSHKAKH